MTDPLLALPPDPNDPTALFPLAAATPPRRGPRPVDEPPPGPANPDPLDDPGLPDEPLDEPPPGPEEPGPIEEPPPLPDVPGDIDDPIRKPPDGEPGIRVAAFVAHPRGPGCAPLAEGCP
ncbi:hypothetical protein A33M_3072 [Rhodovulum sp. PH10]|uniref:hypothetical protein n=1 Tax=Rhodovulum sp. PH10 TaxID=1187851 RepID=UPI00027C1E47|nr:hypothetical protein [Rhodovulum sp. PH10]EJW11459.1 hypothetical protein A33M_3072 [Rhodovulum sp. PH10]